MTFMRRLNRLFSLKAFSDERGVSAVEFALVAPILIAAYLGLSELTLGMMASRRASHLAATIGDLAAQSETLNDANITDLYAIGASIMDPFVLGTSDLEIRITSVTMGADEKAKVDWSDAQNISPYSVGATISSIDTTQLAVGDSLMMTEVKYNFTSPIGNFLPMHPVFSDTFFHHPRNGTAVARVS
jgi:Flp pilus assembly protein TadG